MPVQRALLPEIDVSDQENGDIKHHFDEAKPPRLHVASQIFEDVRPRVEKDGLDVEENEHHGHQVELNGKRLAGVACRGNPAFVGLLFRFVWAAPANERRNSDEQTGEYGGYKQVYQ